MAGTAKIEKVKEEPELTKEQVELVNKIALARYEAAIQQRMRELRAAGIGFAIGVAACGVVVYMIDQQRDDGDE